MLTNFRSKIKETNAWLFASMFFFLPMHVAPAYAITFLILTLSLIEGDFANKWRTLRREPLFWIFQAFFWIFVLSLLWTSDMQEGRRTVGHYGFFLLSGLYLTIARPSLIPRCIGFLFAGCALSEVLAYYNWLQMHVFTDWPAGIRVKKSPEDTAPFVDRILYTPVLAWAGYLAARETWRNKTSLRYVYALLALATLGNLVFSGGRSGQLTFLILLVVWVFQSLAKRPWLAFLTSAVLVGGIATGSYTTNTLVKTRVDAAIHEVINYDTVVNTSVGLRINFYINSFRLFTENPLLGVGAGDFTKEYATINARFTPEWASTDQPHNQYLFVLTTTGAIGGLILLMVYFPFFHWQEKDKRYSDLRIGLMVFIGFVSLFEDYVWRSNTSLLYVLFSTLLQTSRSFSYSIFGQKQPG